MLQGFLRRRYFKTNTLFSLFSNYLPFTKDFFALYFGNVEFPFLKNICTKVGKFNQIVLEENKCENVTKRRTDNDSGELKKGNLNWKIQTFLAPILTIFSFVVYMYTLRLTVKIILYKVFTSQLRNLKFPKDFSCFIGHKHESLGHIP